MTIPLLVLRPFDGALKTAARAGELGLNSVVDPLFSIEPLKWMAPSAGDFDALLVTSANAVEMAGPDIARYGDLPVLAVGEATAQAASEAGLNVYMIGEGGAQDLIDSLSADRYPRILRLAGRHHVEVKTPGRSVTLLEVYESKRLELGKQARHCLTSENIVLLHSKRAAEVFRDEMERAGLDRSLCHIVAFSAKIAAAAGEGWRSVSVAASPDDDALLSPAARLCFGTGHDTTGPAGNGDIKEPE